SFLTPCTTTGQATLNEVDGNPVAFFSPTYWSPTVDTTGLSGCGSLVLNGQAVYGPCAIAQEPYLIRPGFYNSIVINHGTYEFDPGLYDITGTAPVNTLSGGAYFANGIDHSKEGAADFDLCTGGLPTSCPTLSAGVWIGHGGGGVNGRAWVGGWPLVIDEENSSFIHIDARAANSNEVQGLIYQTPAAAGGGVEINLGMASGGGAVALHGQVLAYSFTTFGSQGTMDFGDGYGAGTVSSIPTSGKNETSI